MTSERRRSIWRAGIRTRVVMPLIVLSLLLSSAGGWMIQRAHEQQSRDHVTARAAAIAHAICHLAQTTHDEVELQRFVAAMAAEQGIKLIVVAAGDPLTVVAASRADWVGLPSTMLPDQEHTTRDLTRAITSNQQHVEFEHDSENSVDFSVPLRTRMRANNPLAWSRGAVMLHLDGRPHMRQQAASTAKLLVALFVTIVFAGAAAYGLISFVVLRPAKRIASVARLVAEGERTTRVNSRKSDELGQLAADVDSMLEELVRREEVESQAKEEALSCQRQMESALAELACSNFALDRHSIVAITDLNGVITYVNDKFCEISQYERDELIGRNHRIINSGHHSKTFWSDMWRMVIRGEPWHQEVCNRAKDGSLYWVDTTIVPYKDQDGQITKLVAVRTDITKRKSFEEKLRQSQERFELAVRGSNDGIWDWEIATDVVYYSPRFKELLGYEDYEFPNHLDSFRDHLHVDDAAGTWDAVQRHLETNEPYDVTYRLRTKTGGWRWFRAKGIAVRDSDDVAYRMAGSISDISEIKQIEAQLATEATHDRLTQLPNRALILDRLERALQRTKDQSRLFGLLFLDFDRFKQVNDSLGHEAGDELLRQIAARLQRAAQSSDSTGNVSEATTNGRLGGDEFVVLLEDVSQSDDVYAYADRLLKSLARPYRLGDQEVASTASIGVVVGSAAYDRADDVLRDADMAMYQAKRNGKGCFVVFDHAMQSRVQRHKQLESDLQLAIDEDQLHIEYEPTVDLHSGELLSLEAHLCWTHPTHGCIESAEFNLIAEECGLASELASWMLSTACGQLRHWQQEQGNVIPAALNLNLTPKQFALPDLPRIASEALERYELQPSCLQLEITESALADNMTEATQRIEQLRQIGFRVAIDHFGVGSSSFTSLHRLPVDTLKIDRSMLADLQYSAQAASLIHGLAVIVRNIDISLVAVGIDNADQLIALQGLGCAAAQGQYFGRPMKAECVGPFLRDPANRSYYARGAAAFAVQWAERPDGPTIVDNSL